MLKIRHFQAILSQKKAHFCTSVADIEKVSQLFVNNTITYTSNCYMGQKRHLIDEFPFFFSKTGYSMPFSAHIRVPLIPEVSGTLPDQISISILTCIASLRPLSPLSQYFLFTTRLLAKDKDEIKQGP